MKKIYKVKNPTLFKIKNLIDNILENAACTFKHVLRSENKTADKLANVGIDGKNRMPKSFILLLEKYKIEKEINIAK